MPDRKRIKKKGAVHKDEEDHTEEELSTYSEHGFTKKFLNTNENLSNTKKDEEEILSKEDNAYTKEIDEKKKRKKKSADSRRHIDSQLQNIYQNDDGSMPDMQHFKKRRHSSLIRAFVILFVACVFLGAVAWVGFFVIHTQSSFSENKVTLSVSGPHDVVIGQEVTYKIYYNNNQLTPLAQASLEVDYPKGFVFEHASVVPSGSTHETWNIGAVNGNSSGTITIVGRAYGSIHGQASLRLLFKYTPGNFNSQFQSVSTYALTYKSPSMQLTVDGPSDVVPGQAEQFTLAMKKQVGASTTSSFDHYAIMIMPDSRFTMQSSTPAVDQFGGMQWTIPVASSLPVKLNVIGSFVSSTDSTATTSLHVELIGWKDAAGVALSDGYLLDDVVYPVSFENNVSSINVMVNGSRGTSSIQPGDTLNITLRVQNASANILTDGKIDLLISAPSANNKSILYWDKLNDPDDGYIVGNQINSNVRQGVITWTAKEIPKLQKLKKGQSILVTVNLPVKTSDVIDLSQFATHDIHITGDISYTINGVQHTLTSNDVVLTVNSDAQLNMNDTTTTNEVGQTVHTMALTLTNTYHKLKDISVSTDLFGHVGVTSSTMQVGTGSVIYNPNNKHLVWNIPDFSKNQSQETLTVPITLLDKNPTQTDLSSPITFTATDTVTGQKITQTINPILL